MVSTFQHYAELLARFAEQSHDGYAIFSAHDVLVCANKAFLGTFNQSATKLLGKSFTDIMRLAFEEKTGPKIETQDIEQWLARAQQVRRQREFRLFEVDLIDGRWFLFSEQTLVSGEILLQTKDITKQKILEQHLNERAQRLNDLALTDELTRIANRRSFVASVQSELNRCERLNCHIALLLLDIDHFKSINDNFGHQAGDEVLQQLARLVSSTLREYDIFGRIGGEEFGVFLAETDQKTALAVAERLCQLVASSPFSAAGQQLTVTVSIGVATGYNLSFESLYQEADTALYKAKHSGRNQVALAAAAILLP
ncbi:GGDEF domain-containing protein [Alishewanella sp. BS5-314]|uniref:sensor domain-containing diguanylate cyclase n=1 Tax=Alishewanella sp. BS5-314 TaxID=2755587 RepID=UPI0021BBB1CE|nr:sensor domain-containing diguanylate cyclase [Alishewanella sp. BS5-314]MCT8126758.1 GGDEF domain-containing protein [Alishewanella sp. BS5-314]